MNILIIEDEPAIKNALAEDVIMHHDHYSECDIDYAKTFNLAKGKLEQKEIEYHLIFWDINLGKTDSYNLWPLFPREAFIMVFSETKDWFERLTERFDVHINNNLRVFDRDIKEEINRKSKNGELALMKNKEDLFAEDGIQLINLYIDKAVNKFGGNKVVFIDWHQEIHDDVFMSSIVMITNPIKAFYLKDDSQKLVSGELGSNLESRKIIVLRNKIYITRESGKHKAIDKFVNEKLNINLPHFIRVNESTFINIDQIEEIRKSLDGYDIIMKSSKRNLSCVYYEFTLHSTPTYNVISISFINNRDKKEAIIDTIKAFKSELFLNL